MINYFNETNENILDRIETFKSKISEIAKREGFEEGDINFIFCNNEYLLEMNKTYLRHDYYTDVITFDQSEKENELSGDIYISTDQVKINVSEYKTVFHEELLRVMIHGILHLVGYNDKTEDEKIEMKKKENHYVSI